MTSDPVRRHAFITPQMWHTPGQGLDFHRTIRGLHYINMANLAASCHTLSQVAQPNSTPVIPFFKHAHAPLLCKRRLHMLFVECIPLCVVYVQPGAVTRFTRRRATDRTLNWSELISHSGHNPACHLVAFYCTILLFQYTYSTAAHSRCNIRGHLSISCQFCR